MKYPREENDNRIEVAETEKSDAVSNTQHEAEQHDDAMQKHNELQY